MARKTPRKNPEGGSPAIPRESSAQRAAREKEEERVIYNRLLEEFGGGGPFSRAEEDAMDAELHRLEAKQKALRGKR